MNKNIGLFPCREGGFVRGWSTSPRHLGIDIGRKTEPKAEVLAWQDGKVVAYYSESTGEDWGCSLVLEHNYGNTKRWTGYFHLATSYVVVGQSVKMGDAIGRRGNTGKSTGEHLHFQLTQEISASTSYWANGLNTYAIDPLPFLYKTDGIDLSPYFEEIIPTMPKEITYPSPVARNENVKQVEVLIDYLYLRSGAGTNYEPYEKACTKGIYNVLEEKIDSNNTYNWYRIATIDDNAFWIASGGTRTKDFLPELSREEMLQNQVDELQSMYDAQVNSYNLLLNEYETIQIEKKNIKEQLDALQSDYSVVEHDLDASQQMYRDTQNELETALKSLESIEAKVANAIRELTL